ncbi:hypothetical protein [Dickeya undicola]|uniref:hypothetical protein n=1 Tax=Dickeya undicola TaxID=1577887 RepID=UPI0011CDA3B9|nr:hypothetical protein [Dickeya undicola]
MEINENDVAQELTFEMIYFRGNIKNKKIKTPPARRFRWLENSLNVIRRFFPALKTVPGSLLPTMTISHYGFK